MATFGDINLIENQVKDPVAQENFKRIKIFLRDQVLLKSGFFFRTFTVPSTYLVDFPYKHNLDFIPKDLIVTSVTNGATLTWHYEAFNRDNIFLTASAPTTIRVLLGSYKDDNS